MDPGRPHGGGGAAGGKVVAVDVGSPAAPRAVGSNAEDALTVAARPGDGTIASAGRAGDIRLWDGTERRPR